MEDPLRIALDFDKTYTADRPFWREFIRMCRARGHDVRIVTARSDLLDNTAELFELERTMPVIWCRGVAKEYHCAHFANWVPHIWIDDKPRAVYENSPATPEQLAEWRSTREEGIHYGRT